MREGGSQSESESENQEERERQTDRQRQKQRTNSIGETVAPELTFGLLHNWSGPRQMKYPGLGLWKPVRTMDGASMDVRRLLNRTVGRDAIILESAGLFPVGL